jgi:hypothetical protein
MLAFEIYINGQKRFTAGGEDYQSLNGLLGLLRLPLPKPDDVQITFSASAITQEPVRAALWPTVDLAVGDRVEIRVVDVANVDAPESFHTPDREDEADA